MFTDPTMSSEGFGCNENPSEGWDIYVMDADGSNVTQLTTGGGVTMERGAPVWTAD